MDQMTIRKALDLAAASAYLTPELIDGGIRDYSAKLPTMYNAVAHVPWATNVYEIRRRTAMPTATWSTDGAALPSATRQSFDKQKITIAYIYTRGEVTGPMQRAAGSLFNALALEVETHQRASIEKLSHDIVVADGTSDDITGIFPQTIAGADTLNAGSAYTDASSAYLSQALLDECIDATQGEANMIVTSRKVRRSINALLQAQQQFVDRVEIQAGFRVISYDGIPIVTDMNWEDDNVVLFVRREDCRLLVHQDWTYEELAKTKDSTDFMIKGYFGFALEGRPHALVNFKLK